MTDMRLAGDPFLIHNAKMYTNLEYLEICNKVHLDCGVENGDSLLGVEDSGEFWEFWAGPFQFCGRGQGTLRTTNAVERHPFSLALWRSPAAQRAEGEYFSALSSSRPQKTLRRFSPRI